MINPTGLDVSSKRDALENEAASLIGHMLFEFGRLEMNLGLCLAWIDGGADIDARTKVAERQTLSAKIESLSYAAHAKLPSGSNRLKACANWIRRAYVVRIQRNTLVHGRWGVDAMARHIINVCGLSTSEVQKETLYSLDDLSKINDELRFLQNELGRLRKQWPL